MKKVLFSLFLVIMIVLAGCGDDEASSETVKGSNESKEVNYVEEINGIVETIMLTNGLAESMNNTHADIWSASIKNDFFEVAEVSEILGVSEYLVKEYFDTFKGVKGDEYLEGDFNNHIQGLTNFFEGEGLIEKLKTASETIKKQVKELNPAPAEYENVYNELVDLYTLSEEHIQLAIKPTGSLMSFNDDRGALTKEMVNIYKRIEVIMPENEDE